MSLKTCYLQITYMGYLIAVTNDTSRFIAKDGTETKEIMDAMSFEAESLAINYIATKKLDTSIYKTRSFVAEYKC